MKMMAALTLTICASLLAAQGFAADPKGEFVGSDACKKCHAVEYKSWKETYHSKMVQTRKTGILKEAVEKWSTDGSADGPTTGNVTKAAFKLEDVQYVVGSRWKQRYLVKNDQTGGMQFLNKQFNRYTGKWENYGQKNDWNTMCGTCHTTGYRIMEYDDTFGKHGRTVKDAYSEMNVGCEACHGPGAKHIAAKAKDKKRSIFNPANADIKAQSKVCGYCHIRVENEKFMSAQGNPREDLPAPKVGDTYKAGDDWTKWYPAQVVIPGVHADQPADKEYVGELKGLFKLDEHAKQNKVYDESKHHQQYQGFLQSKHYQGGSMSCITCHSPHAGKGKLKKITKDACHKCHDASFTVEKYMPNTGQTAGNLFVRSHTFPKNPRKGGAGATDMTPPNYYE